MSANPDFSESSSSDDGVGLKVLSADLLPHFPIEFSLLVEDVLLDQLLFSPRQVQFLHFVLQDVECLFPIRLVFLQFLILTLDVGFSILSSVLH